MNIRPAFSVPLPWLTAVTGRFSGRKTAGRGRSIFKLPRSLSVTREGKWFIAILFFIGIAAINTGNNLLYLVVATLLSMIIVSGIISESTLRAITVKRVIPRHIFKGSPVYITLDIKNRKARLPSFSFHVAELEAPALESEPLYILKLAAGEEARRASRYTFLRRGRFTLPGLKVSTRFPFGFFLKGRDEVIEDEVIVYPRVMPFTKAQAPGGIWMPGVSSSSGKGGGTQLYAMRDYTPADDSRFIHWKSAARLQRLLVKEFEKENEKKAVIVFDNYLSDDEAFENAVDEAAGAAGYFVEKGYAVGLKTLTGEIKPRAGHDQLYRLLTELAIITPVAARGRAVVRVTG